MRALRAWAGVVGALALACLPVRAGAQAVGSEFQVNTYTTGYQGTRSFPGHRLIAADANGNFVVVWHGRGLGDAYGIFGQRYDSAGAALGAEFRINSYTTSYQDFPAVAAGASGDFVVVWSSYTQDGSSSGIFGQRYDSVGVPQGPEFRVNSYTRAQQFAPSVAADAAGNFVVVWDSYVESGGGSDVFGQRYDSSGAPLGGEFKVNTYDSASQGLSSVAVSANGDFVVVWSSYAQDGDSYGVFGQRFDSQGRLLGAEFRVNSYTTLNQWLPAVASDADGNFVVVWDSSNQDGSYYGVFGQRYDSVGAPQGGEFRVNSYTVQWQGNAAVASDAAGNFTVAWASYRQDGSSWGVFGQRYDGAGAPQGDEFQISSYTSDRQWFPSVGTTGVDRFVVSWESDNQDGSSYGVFAQRYDFAEATITVVSPNANLRWPVGSVQRIKWTHNLGPAATFRIELDRGDDGDYEELIADAVPVDSATKGSFAWTVTGPPSARARVRVSSTADTAIADASDVTFQIRPPR